MADRLSKVFAALADPIRRDIVARLATEDALAALKAYAFASDRVVDDVADDVLAGRISLSELSPSES